MLNFKKPEISDMPWAAKAFACAKNMNCEYTFGTVYIWATAYSTLIAQYDGFIICRWGRGDKTEYSLPIGSGDFKAAVDEIIADAKSLGIKPRIYGVTAVYKQMLSDFYGDSFDYECSDGNFDYIYNAQDLALLSGKKYHSKRNHIANFTRNYPDWQYEPISAANIDECVKLHCEWIESKSDNVSDYSYEFEAALAGLQNYEALNLRGGIIRVNSLPVAYTFGERLNSECFVCHFEKAPADMQGAYAIINREFAKRLYEDGYKYINREEDLAIDGLRRAKQSYHPAIWLKKESAIYKG
ncbi:MAG: phosphatidylglycerol lysyltransferase domain-containing protein [Clostridiales bacterium]|nr:phosphatidylglycerol lysyltransferase domain-containing protein [Clostridiales bacterium]